MLSNLKRVLKWLGDIGWEILLAFSRKLNEKTGGHPEETTSMMCGRVISHPEYFSRFRVVVSTQLSAILSIGHKDHCIDAYQGSPFYEADQKALEAGRKLPSYKG